MQRYLHATELWGIDELDRPYLMNEIKATSKFQTIKLTRDESSRQHTAEVQLKIARELRDGWKMHGPHPHRKYKIVQKWSNGDDVVVV